MKKLLLIIGLITLAACGEDAYQEADEQNGGMNAPSSFNEDEPGHYNPDDGSLPIPGGNYFSPWDIKYRNDVIPTYTITNTAGSGGHSSIFELRLTPYIGLAYYDGVNDGLYHDPYLASIAPPALIADLSNGNYPNLYANGNEIGELIPALPIILDGSTIDNAEVSIGSFTEHCPVLPLNATNSTGYNPHFRYFDISPFSTPEEQALLAEYGKVFFYEYEIILTSSGTQVGAGLIQVENETLNNGSAYWVDTSISGTFIPVVGNSGHLFYYHNTITAQTPFTDWTKNQGPNHLSVWCDSREVDYLRVAPDINNFFGPYNISVEMVMGTELWMTSGHFIRISL